MKAPAPAALALAALLALNAPPAPAADVSFDAAENVILVEGEIAPGDAGRLAAAMSEASAALGVQAADEIGEVVFDGAGGDFLEALAMGTAIFDGGWGTRVRAGGMCLSSCAVAFLGGRSLGASRGWRHRKTLEPGAVLAFEPLFLDQTERDRASKHLLYEYALRVKVDPGMVTRALRLRSGEELDVVTPETLAGFRVEVDGGDSAGDVAVSDAQAVNVCLNALAPRLDEGDYELAPAAERISADEFRRDLLLLHFKQETGFGPLGERESEIVRLHEEGRTAAVARVYDELAAAGVFPELSGTARVVRVDGLDNVHRYASRTGYVVVENEGTPTMTVRYLLACPLDLFGGFEEPVELERRGGLFYELHAPDERLW